MNLETKITIYKFTPQVFTLTRFLYRKEKPTFYIFYCFSINNPVLYGIWSIV
jgi:hypothetical protein